MNKINKEKDSYKPKLIDHYNLKVMPQLKNNFNLKNNLEVPKILKISLNVGLGSSKDDKNAMQNAINELTTISGQKAVVTKARKAISNFKIRVGDPVGARVTLRKWHMYEFLERLISIALPRVRDFNGLSPKSFDGRGNYNFGLKEQIVFPEINYDKIDKIRGLEITITTSSSDNLKSYFLLKSMGFPFRSDSYYEKQYNEINRIKNN